MDVRGALKEQYHAGLAMLAECVEKCPDDQWLGGAHPRLYYRIAWHAAYFAHNYLVPDQEAFNRSAADWPLAVRTALGVSDTQKAVEVEPYELPEAAPPLGRRDLLDYLALLRSLVDVSVDSLDLDSESTGFSWYPNMTKLSHELMNLRHIQAHVGQLSELLMARGIDIDWVARASAP
jgi:hypothetical protein